jgi:kumamolisin
MANSETVALANSAFSPPAGSCVLRRTDPNRWLELTLGVRRRTPLLDLAAWEEIPPSQRMPMSRAGLGDFHGPDADTLAAITAWAQSHGLMVTRNDDVSARVGLAGTVGGLSEAFGVELFDFEHPDLGEFHARTGAIHLPPKFARLVTGVFGFNDNPIFSPAANPLLSAPAPGPWWLAPQLERLCSCPAANVPGRTIGFVAFAPAGQTADVAAYLSRLGLARPNVQVVPGSAAAGGTAGRPKLVVYSSTFDEKGLVDVLATVIGDKLNDPSVLSIGWGERAGAGFPSTWAWSPALVEHIAESFLAAAHLGISILADASAASPAEARAERASGPLWGSLAARLKSMLYIDRAAGGDTAELLAAFR